MDPETPPPAYPDAAPPRRYDQLAFDETLRASYQREDERYSRTSQATDWLILVGIGVLQFAWMLIVFLIEPGIR
jgi:hypothetical protein